MFCTKDQSATIGFARAIDAGGLPFTRSRLAASLTVAVRPVQSIAWLLSIFTASLSWSAEFTGYAVLTSDYVFRGVSYSDSHAAVQLGGDVAFDSGIYFGAWASTVDMSSPSGQQRDLKVDYYLGYGFDLTNRWSVNGNIVSHNFPGSDEPIDYDFVEYSLAVNYNDRIWFEYSYSPELFFSGITSHNYELYSEWQAGNEFTIGAGVGYYDVSDLTGSGYTYWQFGVTRPFGFVDVDLRYFDTSDSVPFISSPERSEERLVLSIRYQF